MICCHRAVVRLRESLIILHMDMFSVSTREHGFKLARFLTVRKYTTMKGSRVPAVASSRAYEVPIAVTSYYDQQKLTGAVPASV